MTPSDLDAAVTAAQERLSKAQYAVARADADAERAQAETEKLRSHLQTSFGITTIAEAKVMLADLEQQLTDRLADLLAALEEAENS